MKKIPKIDRDVKNTIRRARYAIRQAERKYGPILRMIREEFRKRRMAALV